MEPVHIVWFKRDLRVADHRPLNAATARGPVLPLYVVEPALWREPDMAGRHWQFVAECLAELTSDLAALGQPLVVRVGEMPAVLDDIRRSHGIAGLWSHEETGNGWTFDRDKKVAAWASANGVTWTELPQTGVQRRLKTRNGWAAAWDRQMAEPIASKPQLLRPLRDVQGLRIPTAAELDLAPDHCPGRQRGGRASAVSTRESFLRQRGRHYRREMSSPVTGAMGCSRLSPFLAWGALSMREAAQATWTEMRDLKQREQSREVKDWRQSLRSFTGRLHWHCHFMQKLESEPGLEFTELHPSTRGLRPDEPDAERLKAWANGQTGYPFLDACMRSLASTGWLNFRMRAMVTSFASYNLWLPWRASGLHLARQFTDYEPGIHWPQVQMQSGTTGINTIRMYNVVKQGHDQDPSGVFVRRWLPELDEVPDRHLQEPWTWQHADRIVDRSYPQRIVDLKSSSADAKERIYATRSGCAFRAAADAIQDKHGSRKSGVRGVARKSAAGRARATAPNSQTEFDF